MKVNFAEIRIPGIEQEEILDLRKQIGNYLYYQSQDLAGSELGRNIYFSNGEIEIKEEENKIIKDAENSGVKVAWSNPCIETWFNAYFGKMPNCQDSVSCCNTFSNEYKKNVGQEYHKTDDKLYVKLVENGNEDKAIKIADKRMKEHSRNCNMVPSEMVPATTVYKLVEEIKEKIDM